MRTNKITVICILCFLLFGNRIYAITISGGLDGRFSYVSPESETEARLEGLFLNLRNVWSDELGDRWFLVAQADFDDNFDRIRPYQAYLQYKGPLGKWNIRGGHFLLPFGLLYTYDTERLLLTGLEKTSLGIRKDTGAELFGHFGTWDYAFSITTGLSDLHLFDSRANPVFTTRWAYVQNDWQIGISALAGQILLDPDFGIGVGQVTERRLALDATRSYGPLTLRAEGAAGTDDGKAVGGGNLLADYAITDKLELNTRYANWYSKSDRQFGGIGITYQIRQGLILRFADTFEFGENDRNEITIQIYYEFSKQF